MSLSVAGMAIAIVVFVLVALVIVLLLASLFEPAPVSVADELRAPGAVADVDAAVFRALAAVRGTEPGLLAPGSYSLTVRRRPVWTVLLAIFAFPVGLLALMYRESLRLDVSVTARGDETVIRVAGRSTKAVAEETGRILQSTVRRDGTEKEIQ